MNAKATQLSRAHALSLSDTFTDHQMGAYLPQQF